MIPSYSTPLISLRVDIKSKFGNQFTCSHYENQVNTARLISERLYSLQRFHFLGLIFRSWLLGTLVILRRLKTWANAERNGLFWTVNQWYYFNVQTPESPMHKILLVSPCFFFTIYLKFFIVNIKGYLFNWAAAEKGIPILGGDENSPNFSFKHCLPKSKSSKMISIRKAKSKWWKMSICVHPNNRNI